MQVPEKTINIAINAALIAGQEIMEVYEHDDFNVEQKSDHSPLTVADKRSHKAIVDQLEATGLPILSEEGKAVPYEKRKIWEQFWLIDPLDGTKEFIKRNGEFTVNIALIENNRPLVGVIYIPVLQELYFNIPEKSSFKISKITNGPVKYINIENLLPKAEKLPLNQKRKKTVMVGSRSHLSPETNTFFEALKLQYGDAEILSRGSSLKLCMVAEGNADVYPRFGPTMEWDTGAGHAILNEAGFELTGADGKSPFLYNKENLLNPWFIVKNNQFNIPSEALPKLSS